LDHLHVAELVEDAIAAKYNEVVIVFYLEAFDIWCSDYDFRITSVLNSLCFNVSEGA